MQILPDWLKNGYLRVIDPVANWFVRRGVHPNTITAVGTVCTVAGGVIYGFGHIRTGGFFLSATALFDVLETQRILGSSAKIALLPGGPHGRMLANLMAAERQA